MSSAADFIQALQRRLRLTQYRSRPGEFPPGWQAWLDGMQARSGAVTGASADAILAVFLQRPLAVPPQRAAALNRWQAFTVLWRQEWQPAAREERWLRVLAAAISGVVHLAFAVLVLWLGIARFEAMRAAPKGTDTVVTVQYIGTGAEQVGGGPGPEARPVPEPPEPEAARPVRPAPGAGPAPAPKPEVAQVPRLPGLAVPVETPRLQAVPPEPFERDVPEPAVAEQPLVVSKPVPDRSPFTLPAPTVQAPETEVAVAAPELRLAPPSEPVVEMPATVPEFRPELPPVRIEQPAIRSGVPELAVQEVPAPLPRLEMPPPAPAEAAPALQPQVAQVRERSIPVPVAAPAPTPDPEPEQAPVATASPAAPAPDPVAPTTAAASQPGAQAGRYAGPERIPAPGGWPAPAVDDGWDLGERDDPGPEPGQPDGIYDSQGRVRLADTEGPGSASPGLPPGTVTEEIAHLDRAGTWLRRPPIDYEPTTFARYWRPNETLIAEWVRKSITTIRIPIPGTRKSLVCKTMLIAVGGACDIFDPNLNEQPATARPPPDVPFKPELQQGSGSVPPGG